LLNVPCTSLATPAEITGYEGAVSAVPTAALAAGDLADAANQLPGSDYIREAGGIDCIWSASASPVDHYTTSTDGVPANIEISVQFNAAHAWSLYTPGLGVSGDEGGECDVDIVGGQCLSYHLVGGSTWINISTRKAQGSDPNLIENILNTAVAAVTAAGTPAAPTTPEAGTLALGTQCTDFASTAAVASAVGTSAAVTASTPSQGAETGDIPEWFAAQDSLKDHPCIFTTGTTTQAQIAWIPGGAWAWAEDKTQTLADAPLQALHLTGLGPNDTASIRCAASDASCIVDLVLGGNWVEATVPATSTAASKRSAATAVAQAIVTKLG
jgi:hypothetical protein